MRRAVDQLHEIAQASASQKESDAKILAAALSSAHTLRDVWQQKAVRWRRTVWLCAGCGIIASLTIGLFSWQNLRQADLHQVRLRREIVQRDDQISNLRSQASAQAEESSQLAKNTAASNRMETIISSYAENTNIRFESLALNSENLVQKMSDIARQQNGLLSSITQTLQSIASHRASPTTQSATLPVIQNPKAVVANATVAITTPSQNSKAAPSQVRLLRSRPIDSDELTVSTRKTPQQTWALSEGFLNPSGNCIPRKASTR